jgi:hypothetical protein
MEKSKFNSGKYLTKKYPTIGVCGLDCGLCPRYYTVGSSRCPGCGGPDFLNKHPSCSFITCCVKKKNLEVCAECSEFQCSKFKSNEEYQQVKESSSYPSCKKVIPNLNFIKEHGIKKFVEQQKKRIELLEIMIENFDDGRSKSFFCISCALLPLDKLQETHRFIYSLSDSLVIKEKNKRLKDKLQIIAENLKIDLKLNNKK